MLLARARSTLTRRTRFSRHLGSWEPQFVAARGAPLDARQALSAKVEGDWVLERDDDEAAALAAEAGAYLVVSRTHLRIFPTTCKYLRSSRLLFAGASVDNQVTFVLRVQETRVAILRASMLNGTTGLLVGTQCDPALTLSAVGAPLVRVALDELKARGAERVVAVAPLSGLCAWVVEHRLWEKLDATAPDHDPDQAGAVEAVAKGVPRPGHSVLGQGTFAAARPAFERLASAYVAQAIGRPDPDSEAAMFVHAGGEVLGINWMQATDEESLRDCAGCTAHISVTVL